MTLSTHVAIGAAIGFSIGNPLLGFALGAGSHFLVDMIPHGDSKHLDDYKQNSSKRLYYLALLTTDAALGATLILAIFAFFNAPTDDLAVAAAIFGSILPDILTGIHEIVKTKWSTAYHKLHFFFHDFFTSRYGDIRYRYSIIGQAIVIGLILWWL